MSAVRKQRIVLLLLATILAISQADRPWNLPRATHANSLVSKSNIHTHAIQQYRSKKQLLHAALSIHGGDIDSSDDGSDSDSDTSEYDSSSDDDASSDDEYDTDNGNDNDTELEAEVEADTAAAADTTDEYDDETESEETEDESESEDEAQEAPSSKSLSTSLKKKSKRDKIQTYDDPLSLSAMQDMGVTLGVMLLCNKLDLTNAKIIKYARFAFIAYAIVVQLFLIYVRYRIHSINDTTPITITNPLSSLIPKQAESSSSDMVKNLASQFLTNESTVKEYDLKQANSMNSGLLFPMAMLWFLHFKMGQVQPLFLQTANGVKDFIFSPLVQVHVLGKNLERPFRNKRMEDMKKQQEMMAGEDEDEDDNGDEGIVEEEEDVGVEEESEDASESEHESETDEEYDEESDDDESEEYDEYDEEE